MVKARRNRQPREWHKVTHERSHSGILRGAEVVKVSKLTSTDQLRKVRYNLKKLRRQIEKNKRLANESTTTLERKAWLLAANMHLEAKLTRTIISEMALSDKENQQHQQYLDHQKKIDEDNSVAAKRKLEVKEQKPKYAHNSGFHPNQGGKGKVVERIEKVGVHRRVKRVYQSEIKAPPVKKLTKQGLPDGPVKTINPNRKRNGIVYLPKKKE